MTAPECRGSHDQGTGLKKSAQPRGSRQQKLEPSLTLSTVDSIGSMLTRPPLVDRHCVGRIAHEAMRAVAGWQAHIIEGVPIFLSQSSFVWYSAACCLPHTGSRGHRVQSLPVGTTGWRTDVRSALSTRMTLALILYAFSLPDETNRLTPRFEMASRSAASSRVISVPTFVLFLTDCRELRLVCV